MTLVSQQYRAWSDCTEVQAGLVLYWWQILITFGSSRIKVKLMIKVQRNFMMTHPNLSVNHSFVKCQALLFVLPVENVIFFSVNRCLFWFFKLLYVCIICILKCPLLSYLSIRLKTYFHCSVFIFFACAYSFFLIVWAALSRSRPC